jgi:hypothetical protein
VSYQPEFTITPALLSRVETIAALRERILAATVQVQWIPALQKDTRTRNTHSSTAIEGNPLTLEQVRAVEEGRDLPAVALRARREVVNYFAGLRFVEKNAAKSPLTHRRSTISSPCAPNRSNCSNCFATAGVLPRARFGMRWPSPNRAPSTSSGLSSKPAS